jgi:hypothetical protein
MIDADPSPLYWPQQWPRTAARERTSRYKVTCADARDRLLQQLKLLGATARIISTNIPVRNDGLPRRDIVEPADPGVAVYWEAEGKQHVIACDRWDKVRDNMRACGLAIEALRAMQRSGATQIMDKIYTGFAALPADAGASSWRSVLEFAADAVITADVLRKRYELLALRAHPDRPHGSHEYMAAVNRAYDVARKEIGT